MPANPGPKVQAKGHVDLQLCLYATIKAHTNALDLNYSKPLPVLSSFILYVRVAFAGMFPEDLSP